MNIPVDKQLHFLAGAVIALLLGNHHLWALMATVLIAGAKELYDWYSGKGDPEVMDFIATLIGCWAAIMAKYLLGAIGV